jgi:hypothetical protein
MINHQCSIVNTYVSIFSNLILFYHNLTIGLRPCELSAESSPAVLQLRSFMELSHVAIITPFACHFERSEKSLAHYFQR